MKSNLMPGAYIVMRKVSASEAPWAETPAMEEYDMGEVNENISLPVSYELKGFLLAPIEIGSSICIDRRERNGVLAQGKTETSPIVDLTIMSNGAYIVETLNSVYTISKG